MILRTLIKVGIVAQELLDDPEAVAQMRKIERLARSFGLTFADCVTTAEAGTSSIMSASASSSSVPDSAPLVNLLVRLRTALFGLVEGRLSENSISRIATVFAELESPRLWRKVLDYSASGSEDWQLVRNLRDSFNKLIEARLL